MADFLRSIPLSIAGWDPCGGAGLAADIKTFEICGEPGMGVCSAITGQSHNRFDFVNWVDKEVIFSQLSSLLRSYSFTAVKFGIVESFDLILPLIDLLYRKNSSLFVVWDPVIKASAGYDFSRFDTGEESYLKVMEKVSLLTPNMDEASALFKTTDPQIIATLPLVKNGTAILLKGGHAIDNASDILITPNDVKVIKGERFDNPGKHGSGCVFSAAVCSGIAAGYNLYDACCFAKSYTERFILSSNHLLGRHNL
ncbi:hydroxymethylpyrimidine/phosphomethylpyrimidine kinase [Marinilabiliaceae bacterium ANBcel2]|nr:hydroxymethylpyrimidine/phosphomethylpyrimidine kinase [Marinilabiliaceae bacterium ANBcel2]